MQSILKLKSEIPPMECSSSVATMTLLQYSATLFSKKATSNKSSDFFFLVLLETFVDSNVKAYIILTLLSRQLVLPWAPLPSLTLTPAAVGAEDVQPLYPWCETCTKPPLVNVNIKCSLSKINNSTKISSFVVLKILRVFLLTYSLSCKVINLSYGAHHD